MVDTLVSLLIPSLESLDLLIEFLDFIVDVLNGDLILINCLLVLLILFSLSLQLHLHLVQVLSDLPSRLFCLL
jgi:hypothetical protein